MPIETKPILFNTEMVRAILEGRKCVTRRAVKPQPPNGARAFSQMQREDGSVWRSEGDHVWAEIKPPYHPGDILYVRETFWRDNAGKYYYKADDNIIFFERDVGLGVGWIEPMWKPSIHMPKEAARIFLRVTDVRVERLRDITISGVQDEGLLPSGYISQYAALTTDFFTEFSRLWDTTIKPADLPLYGWLANPWVCVIWFEQISKEAALKSGDVI